MIYLDLGRREQGKTTLGRYHIKRCPKRVVFDPRGLVPTDRRLTQIDDIDPAFDDLMTDDVSELVITPDNHLQECFQETALAVKGWVRDANTPSIGFLVDELRFVDLKTAESFDWLLRCATRAQVTIAVTAHRPVDVPPDMRAISDVWCLFRITQEHDLKVIAERCSDDVVERVQDLPPRHFIAWDDTRGTWRLYDRPGEWNMPLLTAGSMIRPADDDPALPSIGRDVGQRTLFGVVK